MGSLVSEEGFVIEGTDLVMKDDVHIYHCYEVLILQSHTTITRIQSQGYKYFKINIYCKTLIIYIQATQMSNNR